MSSRVQALTQQLQALFAKIGTTVLRHRAQRVLPGDPDEIWRLWEDPSGWDRNMVSVRDVTVGPHGQGTVFEAKMRMPGGFTTTQREEIVEYEPPRRIAVRGGQWGVAYQHGITLAPEGEGHTRCVCDSEVTIQGPLRLAAPMIRRLEKRGLDDKLKLLETHLTSRRT